MSVTNLMASALTGHGDVVCVSTGPEDGFLAKRQWPRPGFAGSDAPTDLRSEARVGAHTLISHDPAMTAVVRRAEQIAWSEASALIQGESGTGKEVLARHIHRHSRRAKGPFVALNCAAIPEHLLESELFGHERGAFSGAIGRRIGKFEAAQGGTILLDEISEMDLRLQAKLLRALQEREVDRVGGKSPVRIDVRVIATTNKDLWAEVACKTFRQDLFFRLNVAPLLLPPLRDRPSDIDALMDYFIGKYATQNGLAAAPVSAAARALLRSYGWPGNVRELENVVHRAVVISAGGVITDDVLDLRHSPSLPTLPQSSQYLMPCAELHPTPYPAPDTAFVARSLTEMERGLILSTLEFTRGNRTRAATILGISIRALRNKLRDYAASGIAVPAPMSPGRQ